ncbi:MAG TPA: CGNR zinc finger domain-containing protein [Steroidobacteraceae bacterium]|nr:CGNR zinc finger domain-containing protein [Steroidobacteraceae bacterium]
MNFRRYSFEVPFGALAENLVNSLDLSIEVPEHLGTVAQLVDFLKEHDIAATRRVGAADLDATKDLRSEVRALFEAESTGAALQQLNRLLEGAQLDLAVVRDKGSPRLRWSVRPALPLADSLRAAVAVNIAHIVETFGFERLRVCGASPCADVFLDVSKRGEQKFCGPRCATRTRVAAHRARQ